MTLNNQTAIPLQTASRTIIRFQDCDPLQHLNNAKYFDYFFNSREDQVAKLYNFSLAKFFFEQRTSWVVYQHTISYVRPAKVSEMIWVFSRVIYYDETSIITEFYMTNDEQTELKTLLLTTSKYINVDVGKSTPHQPELMAYLGSICPIKTDPKQLSVSDRIKVIKHNLRK